MESNLIPLEQWYCDSCHEVITNAGSGMVHWSTNADKVIDEYKIVHKRHIKKGCDENAMWWAELDTFKKEAISELIAGRDYKIYDERIRKDLFARFLVPYYEEARKFFGVAQSEGLLDLNHPTDKYLESNCKKIAKHYNSEEQK